MALTVNLCFLRDLDSGILEITSASSYEHPASRPSPNRHLHNVFSNAVKGVNFSAAD
jgi:hypothetical protein